MSLTLLDSTPRGVLPLPTFTGSALPQSTDITSRIWTSVSGFSDRFKNMTGCLVETTFHVKRGNWLYHRYERERTLGIAFIFALLLIIFALFWLIRILNRRNLARRTRHVRFASGTDDNDDDDNGNAGGEGDSCSSSSNSSRSSSSSGGGSGGGSGGNNGNNSNSSSSSSNGSSNGSGGHDENVCNIGGDFEFFDENQDSHSERSRAPSPSGSRSSSGSGVSSAGADQDSSSGRSTHDSDLENTPPGIEDTPSRPPRRPKGGPLVPIANPPVTPARRLEPVIPGGSPLTEANVRSVLPQVVMVADPGYQVTNHDRRVRQGVEFNVNWDRWTSTLTYPETPRTRHPPTRFQDTDYSRWTPGSARDKQRK